MSIILHFIKRCAQVNNYLAAHSFVVLALLASSLLTCPSAASADSVVPPTLTLTFDQPLNPPSDAAVSTMVAETASALSGSADTTCTLQRDVQVTGTPVLGWTPSGSTIYQTGVPGIGIRFSVTDMWNGQYTDVPLTQALPVWKGAFSVFLRGQLIVTGPIGSGPLGPFPTVKIKYSGPCISPVETTNSLIATSRATVRTPTCEVLNSKQNVVLPPVSVGSLPDVGSTAVSVPLNIQLNCPQNANVFVTMSDALNGSNRSSVLSIGSGATAKGVGIALFRSDNSRINFGPDSSAKDNSNQWFAGTTRSSGTFNIPMRASYVRTDVMSPGTVSASATFTLSYQ